jgi:hypothetical protein
MRTLKTALFIGALTLTTVMGCGQRQGCTKDAGGNTDCPATQYNPPGGLVNDPRG